jgi:diguanylate cyclase (GGDEF)-like protein/PAS domain S-box-containing protein
MFQRSLNILRALPTLVAYLDRDLRFCFVNEAHGRWQGQSPDGIIGKYVWDIVGPDMREITERKMREALAGASVEHEFDADVRGEPRCFRVSYSPDRDDDGSVLGIVTLVTDLTERRRIEQDLRNSERTFDGAFRNAAIGKAVVDLDGVCSRVNPALAMMLGYTVEELTGLNFRVFTHPDDLEADLVLFRSMIAGAGDGYQIEKRYLHRDGSTVDVLLSVSVVRDDGGTPLRFVSEIIDISQRKAQQMLLHHQALTDHLTGLLNRRGFDGEIASCGRTSMTPLVGIGILIVDLDRFKEVNDRFGHAVGDTVLIEAAERIGGSVRSTDKIGRLGGDEFAVLLPDSSRQHTSGVAARVVKALARPFAIDGVTVMIGASVGAAFSGDPAMAPEELLREADRELYRAKDAGRGNWRLASVAS